MPSLGKLFGEFEPCIRFGAFTSQEFVHCVLPCGVLSLEKISSVSAMIRRKEEPEAFRDSAVGGSAGSDLQQVSPEPRLGLNQARDLLQHEFEYGGGTGGSAAGVDASSSPLRYGHVHISEDDEADDSADGRRFGPGYYQCSRFSSTHRLLIVSNWPDEYVLKFKSDRALYLMGACVTETDRKFYSPKVRG